MEYGDRIVVAFIIMFFATIIAAYVFGGHAPVLPRCHEDQVIVGIGQFDDGLWSEYQCGPSLDDWR